MGRRADSAIVRASELGHRAAGDRPRRPPERDFRDALDELNANVSRLTQEVAHIRGNSVNHVLFSGTGKIPAAGDAFWTTQMEVPYARVVIVPIVADLRIENAPPRDVTAGAKEGRGFIWCPVVAGRLDIPLTGNVITVYGAAGTFFDLALLANPIA